MQNNNDVATKLSQVMEKALLELHSLIKSDPENPHDVLSITKLFLLGVVSTSIDLTEAVSPNSAPFLYADVEAAAKAGGIHAIKKAQEAMGSRHYSVSNIAHDDMTTAMNYLGQELGAALFKGLHELPMPLRKPEMMLRGIEALLANLLNQKFNNFHEVLDSLCEHVHMALFSLDDVVH